MQSTLQLAVPAEVTATPTVRYRAHCTKLPRAGSVISQAAMVEFLRNITQLDVGTSTKRSLVKASVVSIVLKPDVVAEVAVAGADG